MRAWFPSGVRGAVVLAVLVGLMGASVLRAAEPQAGGAASSAEVWQSRDAAVTKAIDYLRSRGQAADGSFSAHSGPAITALVATAMINNGRTVQDPAVARALAWLEKFVQPDGSICHPESSYRNYETCVAVMCFTAANQDGRYNAVLAGADRFLKGLQWDETEGHGPESTSYGGAGYGGHKRPDLSNTSFLIEALRATGNDPDDEAIQKALIFVSRCQNLETEHNTTEFSVKNPDGGFYYTPAAGGTSQAGETPEGGLRSYASMTYAGLKSMIYAGLGPDDPRVAAALQWIARHYSLDDNPGMGDAGLYYYYHTFAKALDVMGKETFEDAEGNTHRWREELARELVQRQRDDGSWTNSNSRWLEGDANLVTSYALLALAHCKPQP